MGTGLVLYSESSCGTLDALPSAWQEALNRTFSLVYAYSSVVVAPDQKHCTKPERYSFQQFLLEQVFPILCCSVSLEE